MLYHTQAICEQIEFFDQSAAARDPILMNAVCMQFLIDLARINKDNGKFLKKARSRAKRNYRRGDNDWRTELLHKSQKQKTVSFTKATTTQLINHMFENFFPDQLVNTKTNLTVKRRKCGVCEPCQQPDCGECMNCKKNMIKFGGSGRSKQACIQRQCRNIEIQVRFLFWFDFFLSRLFL